LVEHPPPRFWFCACFCNANAPIWRHAPLAASVRRVRPLLRSFRRPAQQIRFTPCPIFTSTNSGLNWTASPYLSVHWTSVASSADGTKLVAGTDGDSIYTSTDSGVTWTTNSTLQGHWSSVASSADGTKLIASLYEIPGDSYGAIYISTDSGANWTQATNLPSGKLWTSVSSSADGTKLAAVEYFTIYTSKDSGTTWTAPTSVNYNGTIVQPILYDSSVASSADGTKLVAGGDSGWIYTSTNSGANWTLSFSTNVATVASSADGNKLVAAAEGGLVYTSYSTPAPYLDIAPLSTNLSLSWIIPSTNFVLQQNFDLTTTNWATLTNVPTLNLTNLQNQVMVCPSNTSGFYRLQVQ
jgi:photosystem II stability/assembly factor-like uncharacterized protein